MGKLIHNPISLPPRKLTLRVGFVPLTDCAPLVMAQELGLYRRHGLNVVLSRELGWATIRDKVIFGELDAAHAVAGMPFAASLGLADRRCDCLTGLVLNLHGNAITLSEELWRRGVRHGAGLRQFIAENRRGPALTFGVVYSFSSHNFLLRQWLTAHGIQPDRDVRIVVLPPRELLANLRAGHLDGYCVGEPWNSRAVQSGTGWVVATSSELAPGHPEKVLMVRGDFAEHHAAEHEALIAALLEACAFCDVPQNHPRVLTALSRPEYLNLPVAALEPGLTGRLAFGHEPDRVVRDFTVFARDHANEPSPDKAAWVLQQLRASGLVKNAAELTAALGRRVFRSDIFERAAGARTLNPDSHHENEIPDTRLAHA